MRPIRPLLSSLVVPLFVLTPAVLAQTGDPAPPRGFLGVSLEPVSDAVRSALALEEGRGVMVGTVVEGSAAEEAGMVPGDVILAVDDRPVRGPRELIRTVSGRAPGDQLDLEIWRQGRLLRASVSLMKRPDARAAGRSRPRPAQTAGESRLGITGVALTDQLADYFLAPGGVLITRIAEGSAAEVAGLLAGDVVVAVADTEVGGLPQLERLIAAHDETTILFALVRDGNDIFVEVALD